MILQCFSRKLSHIHIYSHSNVLELARWLFSQLSKLRSITQQLQESQVVQCNDCHRQKELWLQK